MKELKLKYESLKSLAKEMMKVGNVQEYFRILNEMNQLQLSLIPVKR